MRKFPFKTLLWAGIFLLCPWVATAAGLGKLTILSSLGQPLSAEVDLVSVQKEELSTLAARIASPDAFQQANMQYSPALIGVRMTIERRANGSPYIKIVSTRSINDPFLAVLIELTWAQGRLLREYTALLDPPGYTPVPTTPPVLLAAPIAPPVVSTATPLPVTGAANPLASSAQPQKPIAPPARASARGPVASTPAPSGSVASEYAVKRGDTLAKIAAGVKPEGVTLDQMLVSLYRNNTDAFAGNMNRLKTGTILRVPEKDRIAETPTPEAAKEVRVQSSNWNAYRLKLAEAAGAAPVQETAKSASSGRITTAVEDKAAAKDAPKEVLKLSKGDSPSAGKAATGKTASAKDRVRMLEEDAVAKDKSLTEANERVAQLEKNIKDMQRLLEIKGVAIPGVKAPAGVAPPAKADQVAKGESATAVPPAKVEPAKIEPAKDAAKALVDPPKSDAKSPIDTKALIDAKGPADAKAAAEVKAPATVAEPPKGEAPQAELPKAEAPKAVQAKPKVTPPPPPVAEPSLVDQIIAAVTDPIYLAGGLGGLVVLGGGAWWLGRRRRAGMQNDDIAAGSKKAPTLAGASAANSVLVAPRVLGTIDGGDDVDPLAEADLYLNFGRDAQAEEVLKEALQKNPQHEEAELKLLQIYAARKDKAEFEKVAKTLNAQTSGFGDVWLKAAAMGYAFDPQNSLYEAGKSVPIEVSPVVTGSGFASTDLDFDLELSPGSSPATTDVPLDSGERTMILKPGELAAMAVELEDVTATQDVTHDSVTANARHADSNVAPDFTLDAPAAGAEAATPDLNFDSPADELVKTNVTADSAVGPMAGVIDFNFDAPAVVTPDFNHDATIVITPQNQVKAAGLDIDFDIASDVPVPLGTSSVVQLDPGFKLDLDDDAPLVTGVDAARAPNAIPDIALDDISLNLDEAPAGHAAAPAVASGKDDHWYDVQTKFDLAKAYQEMGDNDGAREILQEVTKEGDTAQQAEAKQLLESLA